MEDKLTVVMVAMHTSPLAQPGQGDAGGLNVYVRNLSEALIRLGHQVLAFTRKASSADVPVVLDEKTRSQVIPIAAGRLNLPKEALAGLTAQFADAMCEELTQRARHRVVFHSHYWLSGLAALEAGQRLQAPVYTRCILLVEPRIVPNRAQSRHIESNEKPISERKRTCSPPTPRWKNKNC